MCMKQVCAVCENANFTSLLKKKRSAGQHVQVESLTGVTSLLKKTCFTHRVQFRSSMHFSKYVIFGKIEVGVSIFHLLERYF